jgi:hypothetical protein
MPKKKSRKKARKAPSGLVPRTQEQFDKEYWEKIRKFVSDYGYAKEFELIPEVHKYFILQYKQTTVKLISDERYPYPDGLHKELQQYINTCLKENNFESPKNRHACSLFDAATYIHSFLIYIRIQEDINNDESKEIYKNFKDLLDLFDHTELIKECLQNVLNNTSMHSMGLGLLFFAFVPQLISQPIKIAGQYDAAPLLSIKMVYHLTSQSHITINNQKRSIHAMEYIHGDKVEQLKIKASEVDPNNSKPEQMLPIYFQSHAVNRFFERADCISNLFLFVSSRMSFEDPQLCRVEGYDNLLEYRLGSTAPIGYFKYLVQDNKFIVITFLLKTCSGTPEGDKFNDLMKLHKKDSQFFQLDKLSKFAETNMEKYPIISEMLMEAGCHGILDASEKYDFNENTHLDKLRNFRLKSKMHEVNLMEES